MDMSLFCFPETCRCIACVGVFLSVGRFPSCRHIFCGVCGVLHELSSLPSSLSLSLSSLSRVRAKLDSEWKRGGRGGARGRKNGTILTKALHMSGRRRGIYIYIYYIIIFYTNTSKAPRMSGGVGREGEPTTTETLHTSGGGSKREIRPFSLPHPDVCSVLVVV